MEEVRHKDEKSQVEHVADKCSDTGCSTPIRAWMRDDPCTG
jgi:hypothetical protein